MGGDRSFLKVPKATCRFLEWASHGFIEHASRGSGTAPYPGVRSFCAKFCALFSLRVGGHLLGDNNHFRTLSVSTKHPHGKSTDRARGSLTTAACGKSPSHLLKMGI